MSAVEGGIIVVLALLAVVVVALVRTQAANHRRLDLLERKLMRSEKHTPSAPATVPSDPAPTAAAPAAAAPAAAAPAAALPEGDAVDVRGTDVSGQSVTVPLEAPPRPTLLAFLSTSCGICTGLWQQLAERPPGDVETVVVTKDEADEDLARVTHLGQEHALPVVLSTEAWDDYEVPSSPYFLLVDGTPGSVVAEGRATDWDSVRAIAQP